MWTGAENLGPAGFRTLNRPAHSESLYRLRYSGVQLYRRCAELVGSCGPQWVRGLEFGPQNYKNKYVACATERPNPPVEVTDPLTNCVLTLCVTYHVTYSMLEQK